MSGPHLVVVGAALAELRAVEAARKAGHIGPITLVGAEAHLPYDRPPLSKAYLDDGDVPEVVFREEQYLRDELGVTLELGRAAAGLDAAGHTVRVGNREIGYDAWTDSPGPDTGRRCARTGTSCTPSPTTP